MSDDQAVVIRTHAHRDGEAARVTLAVELPPGVHIEPHEPQDPYLIPTVIEVDGLPEAGIEYPTATVKQLGWNGATLSVLEGTLEFVVSGLVPPEVTELSGTLAFQPCVGGTCLPRRTVRWVAPVTGTTTYAVVGALAA